EAFRNNVGTTGKIFTDDNKYNENTSDEVFKNFERTQRREKDKELMRWASTSIKRGSYLTYTGDNLTKEVRVSKSNIESLLKHIATVEYKEMVKSIDSILKKATYSHSADLGEGTNKDSKNIGRKRARGVLKYNYYISEWNNLKIQIAMEEMRNGYEQPYAIVF